MYFSNVTKNTQKFKYLKYCSLVELEFGQNMTQNRIKSILVLSLVIRKNAEHAATRFENITSQLLFPNRLTCSCLQNDNSKKDNV